MLQEYIEKVLQHCSVCRKKKCFSEFPLKKNGAPKSDVCKECKLEDAKKKRAESAAKRKAEKAEEKAKRAAEKAAVKKESPKRKAKKPSPKKEMTLSMAVREEMLSKPARRKPSPKRTRSPSPKRTRSPARNSSSKYVTRAEFDAMATRLEAAIVGLWHATDLASAVGETSNFHRDLSRDQLYEMAKQIDSSGQLLQRLMEIEGDKKKIHYRNAMLDKSFHGCVVPPHRYAYNYIPDPREDIPGAQAAIDKLYPCECKKNKEAMFTLYIQGTNPNDKDMCKFEAGRRRKGPKDLPHSPRV